MPDKVIITPATGKIVFQADKLGDGNLTEVGYIDAESGSNANQIEINKARMINGEITGGTF